MAKRHVDENDDLPSTCTDKYWLFAERKTGTYPEYSERTGKWLIFVPVARIDNVWATIRTAVENGQLGRSAKVATARDNPNAQNPKERVICVYTYDYDDREDVFRIRQVLRDLGFTQKLAYKTDDATSAGLYRVKGNARISLYYE